MADTPAFESPVIRDYPTVPASEALLTITDVSSLAKTIVRAGADTGPDELVSIGFGSSNTQHDVLVCGQRPGEWLLVGSAPANRHLLGQLDLSGHLSIIDHTHSRAMFRLTGEDASKTLEKVCSLDWGDKMTPDGAVVSASVAKVGCDIIRNDRGGEPSYLVACDRSFGQYLFDVLLDAGTEFGIGVALGVSAPSDP